MESARRILLIGQSRRIRIQLDIRNGRMASQCICALDANRIDRKHSCFDGRAVRIRVRIDVIMIRIRNRVIR